MTADGPASGLPQEAVDAVMRAIPTTRQWAKLAVNAALPYLREQWEAEADALAAERAKVAALREQTIRECIDALRAGDAVEWALGTQEYGVELLRALLGDAHE